MNAEALSGKVLGTCTLQKLIGRGGMGAVFLAQQSRPRRQVAVKVLLPMVPLQKSQLEAFLKRFQRETDAAASLEHPNIMPVHEYGESEGLAYLVMPYVGGGTLRDELDREGKLPLTQVVSYLEQMADALTFAHERGIIHRDIKPANIMLTPDKRLLLTDFGLAKIVADGHISQNPLSDVGMPMGTPDYMSPEQVVGGEIDARADIYALAVLTYHMITGSVPFKGETPMKVALQHLHNAPPPLRPLRPDLPPKAEQAILRAMAKRPGERYTSGREFASVFRQALEEAGVMLDPQPTVALPIQNGERTAPNRRRSLFDPVWRNAAREGSAPVKQSPTQGQSHEGDNKALAKRPAGSGPAENVGPLMMQAPADANYTVKDDIVAKTSMTLPSFSGLLVPPSQTAAASQAQKGTKAAITSITPLPATQDMENSSFYPKPGPHNPPSPLPPGMANPVPNEKGPNNQFSPPRMRLGNKTNLLGKAQSNQGPQGPQMGPGNPGQVQPDGPAQSQVGGFGNYPMGQSPASNPSFWSQAGAFGDQAPIAQGYGGNQLDQPRRPTGSLSNNPQAGGMGGFNPFGPQVSQPGMGVNSTFQNGGQPARVTGMLPPPGATGALTYGGRPTGSLSTDMMPGATGALQMIPGNENTGQTGMLKLTQSVKVVKVPVAGQPGQYVTGLLPVLPGAGGDGEQSETPEQRRRKKIQMIALIMAVLVIVSGSLFFVLSRQGPANSALTNQTKTTPLNPTEAAKATAQATANAKATADAQANIILIDPMQTNAHNWYVGKRSNQEFSFKDGSYHIRNGDDKVALAILPDPTPPEKFAYTFTLQQVAGADDDEFNRFGLIIRYNSNDKQTTFYSFELANNTNGGKYFFQKFDSTVDPQWTELWSKDVGKECHIGTKQSNTFKIVADKDRFVFFVNGKQVGDTKDGSYKNGQVGMFINEKDVEVTFKDLSLTRS